MAVVAALALAASCGSRKLPPGVIVTVGGTLL
jgi:hypothetical protein